MNRELNRLQVHNPCSDGAEIGVFASPTGQRRNAGPSPRAPKASKKRARLPELGEVSLERGDTLVPSHYMLEEQVVSLRHEVNHIRMLLHTLLLTHRPEVEPSRGHPRS